jgi:hypothetical protein
LADVAWCRVKRIERATWTVLDATESKVGIREVAMSNQLQVFLAFLIVTTSSPTVGQNIPIPGLKVSPEATRTLSAQPSDLGNLIPLHAASVLRWLCSDPVVQAQLTTTKAGCYQRLAPSAEACIDALQERAPTPAAQSKGERLDIVTFRSSFRSCVKDHYAAAQAVEGKSSPLVGEGTIDPVAVKMNQAQIAR